MQTKSREYCIFIQNNQEFSLFVWKASTNLNEEPLSFPMGTSRKLTLAQEFRFGRKGSHFPLREKTAKLQNNCKIAPHRTNGFSDIEKKGKKKRPNF
ncbi:MAG: hypothetical protein II547_07400 [Treponema sp.]|nr:hypothetical protein [Treponema sp.]